MTQHNFSVADTDSGLVFRNEVESLEGALQTMHSGSTAPSYVATGLLWADTTTANLIAKQYDGAGSVPVWQIDATNDVARVAMDLDADSWLSMPTDDQLTLQLGGSTAFTWSPTAFSVFGRTIALDADSDTSISAATDDQIVFTLGAATTWTLTATTLTLSNGHVLDWSASDHLAIMDGANGIADFYDGAVYLHDYTGNRGIALLEQSYGGRIVVRTSGTTPFTDDMIAGSNNGVEKWRIETSGDMFIQGSLVQGSDEAYKASIEPIPVSDALAAVRAMGGDSYNRILEDDENPAGPSDEAGPPTRPARGARPRVVREFKEFGFRAQSWENGPMAHAVRRNPRTGRLGLVYSEAIPPLAVVVRHLLDEVDALKARVAALEAS